LNCQIWLELLSLDSIKLAKSKCTPNNSLGILLMEILHQLKEWQRHSLTLQRINTIQERDAFGILHS
jgi:hypothetical protein